MNFTDDLLEGPAMRILLVLPLLFAMSLPVQAQTKYSAWSNPDQKADGSTQELIERLDKLIDEAEKARAADPAFLRDLRDLARSYGSQIPKASSQPAKRVVLSDDFRDGDFTANPTWSVTEGRYWIEQGWGLRSAIAVTDPNQQQQQTKKSSNRDAALALLGAVLNQSVGGKAAPTNTAEPKKAAIHAQAAIANAFTLEFEFSSWVQKDQPSGGRFEIGPYQGADRSSGYRLAYTPGKGLTLLIVSPRGQRVIDQQAGPMALEDKKSHAITWSRDGRGKMSISVDGREILATVDRGFGDPFQGLALSNGGGDFIIKRVTVTNGG